MHTFSGWTCGRGGEAGVHLAERDVDNRCHIRKVDVLAGARLAGLAGLAEAVLIL